jgi:hypothetical protein
LPGREIKVLTGKGKNPTKADIPAVNVPEASKVMEGRGVVLDAVLSPSDHVTAKAYKVWEGYDCMSADPGDDATDRQTTTHELRAAAEGFFSIFGCC